MCTRAVERKSAGVGGGGSLRYPNYFIKDTKYYLIRIYLDHFRKIVEPYSTTLV